jgi:hypothetical protein
MPKKLTYEYVKEQFEINDCELLETEYINTNTKMKYRCNCGNVSYIKYNHFKHGHRCRKCGTANMVELCKLNYDYVYQYFLDHNCILLEKEYINSNTKMKYICECGNESTITWGHFSQGKRCSKCGLYRRSSKQKLPYDYVYNYFKEQGCELLENTYTDNHTKMKYRCNCGRIDYINFNNFKEGKRCRNCFVIQFSGSNHPNWNPNLTDEERSKKRKNHENYVWRNEIFKRDNYTCQVCGKHGNKLRSHHLDGYHWCIDKRFDLDNGITLCKDCHNLFHKQFGYKNNTKDQFLMFKNNQINIK